MNAMARNIASFYGTEVLEELISLLKSGTSLAEIGRRMNVSRQRVHQWKQQLGKEVTVWEPDPSVLETIHELKNKQGG